MDYTAESKGSGEAAVVSSVGRAGTFAKLAARASRFSSV